ncbi:thymidylate kinase [Bengtsoniella intestinalis]|uniref:dTMP kinase n=1 Tax=Bengtsoniella intestinalis TaxID=3073143 RepID=UPI00391F222A
MSNGVLIVIEGTDGSGKATQAGRLLEKLQAMGKDCRGLDFPRYGKPSATMVEQYLGGAFGNSPEAVNAYAASLFYAVDRYASYKEDWGDFYHKGGILVSNRYTTSNAVHQGSKLEGQGRADYLTWLSDLEYHRMAIPEPTLVVYLDMPTAVTEQLMAKRQEATHTTADIHEQDGAYLRRCRDNAKAVAQTQGWQVISCASDGVPRSMDDISQEIWDLVAPLLACPL